MTDETLGQQLDSLWQIIEERKDADPDASYTARLLAKGSEKAARKVGEEAIEAIIEVIRGDGARLAEETADLLFHVLVMLASAGVEPGDVAKALKARETRSGLEEKAARAST